MGIINQLITGGHHLTADGTADGTAEQLNCTMASGDSAFFSCSLAACSAILGVALRKSSCVCFIMFHPFVGVVGLISTMNFLWEISQALFSFPNIPTYPLVI